MQLFNIGAEGQLYLGAVGASWIALQLGDRDVTWPPLFVASMCVAGAVLGALWALIPGVLRAFARTNEIITSLMLNYVAGLLLTYLIFDSSSYWRDTSTLQARSFPQGKPMPEAANWPTFGSSVVVPLGFLVGACRRARRMGPVLADALRVRGERHGRLATRGALLGHADAAEDPRGDGPVGGDRRHRRREPDRRLHVHARRQSHRPAGCGVRLHRHRRRGPCALQPVRRLPRRHPASGDC